MNPMVKKNSFRLSKIWGSTDEGMPAVTKQDATDRASPPKVLPHPLTCQRAGSPHDRNIQSSCWVAMWDSQEKTHSPSMSHSFSLHTHSDAAICFRHPKDNSGVIAITAQCCARQPGHSIPSHRHFQKSALLVLAIRHWVSYCSYSGHLHHTATGALPGGLWAPASPMALVPAPLQPLPALYTALLDRSTQ